MSRCPSCGAPEWEYHEGWCTEIPLGAQTEVAPGFCLTGQSALPREVGNAAELPPAPPIRATSAILYRQVALYRRLLAREEDIPAEALRAGLAAALDALEEVCQSLDRLQDVCDSVVRDIDARRMEGK